LILFYDEQETFLALNALESSLREGRRPLVLWIGAGASTWAGYELWDEVASSMHSVFSREEGAYARPSAAQLLQDAQYPELFELMRLANETKYLGMLAQRFAPKQQGPVYERFLRVLEKFSPLRIVTTNVDEAVEHSLPVATVQRSDIERMPSKIASGQSFVVKLHGSVSSVKSMVFSTRDYDRICSDARYQSAIRGLFEAATVLFLGYGLRDEYVLKCIQEAHSANPLFGVGPHYIVTPTDVTSLPPVVRRIRYVVGQSDHRASLAAIEAIGELQLRQGAHMQTGERADESVLGRSIYFIGDVLSPGQWTTSQTLQLTGDDGRILQALTGPGYVDGEVVVDAYTTLHDVIVGLLCFDIVCAPLDHVGSLHNLLGSEAFWMLTQSESVQLVLLPGEPAVMFSSSEELVGDIGAFNALSSEDSSGDLKPISIEARIRRQLKAVPGREREAEALFASLAESVVDLSNIDAVSIPDMTRGALIHPSIRRMLGISQGTPRGSIPRWLAFPVLRLAQVVQRGVVCQQLQASATRMILGSEKLASVAFAAATGDEWADEAASYALTGRFNSDLGAIVCRHPELIQKILQFRETEAGHDFRKEVAERLAKDEGSEVFASINAGLRQALPSKVLQNARDQLSGLFVSQRSTTTISPAIWGDLRNADSRIEGWRKQSRARLLGVVNARKLQVYDQCPCGSGEKLKFCCMAALS
jgi:hypothetical protein